MTDLGKRLRDLEADNSQLRALAECGATHPNVLGRCGRDAGHQGRHRSTGETFTACFDTWPRPPAPPRPETLPSPAASTHPGSRP